MSEVAWAGRFLEMRTEGKWEFVGRTRGIGAAVILAIEDGHVLLVEQTRVPLGRRCLELPAGLVGDESVDEDLTLAAARELEEETGYRAARIEPLGEFASSPGLTSETFVLMRATGLTRISAGGGVDGEEITVHRVALDAIADFVAAKRAAGVAVDVKIAILLAGGWYRD